jgi:endo-1,4-beta-xylanase
MPNPPRKPPLSSRAVAVLAALLALFPVASPSAQGLRQLAEARGIRIGVAYKNGGGAGTYNNTLAREFNAVVGENNMKWGSLQATRGNFTYGDADGMVQFAQQNAMGVRGHNFVWHQQSGFAADMPAQSTVKATRDTMFKIMKSHITTVMQRYKGKIYEWDIVNEAVARDSAGMRLGTGTSSSFWSLRTDAANHDWDFVDSAFTYARQADSTAVLFYNDYDCEGMGKKSGLVYSLVSRLKAKKLIDGVGLQCHFYVPGTSSGSNGAFPADEMAVNLRRLSDLGLRISLTEVDFRIPTPASAANLQAQRLAYEKLMGLCLANPACKTIVFWGLNDGQSWIPGNYTGQGAPLLFDDGFKAKPAYDGVASQLKDAPTLLRSSRARKGILSGSNRGNQALDVLGTLGIEGNGRRFR